ncbi:putative ribonuclease H-like domain-containing protein [Tanacetum coccineum]
MDLKWQLALLSMRTRKFFQKTGRKITINESDTTGYDKSKPEFEGYGPKTSKSVSEDTSNEVRESLDASLVEDLVLNDKPKVVNIVRPNTAVVNAVRANQVNAIKASGNVGFATCPISPTLKNLMEDMLHLGEEANEEELLVKELLKLIPSGEIKIHIEVLSVLWGNRLLLLDSSLPLSSDAGKKDDESGIDDQEKPKNSTQDVNTAGPSINTASINVNTGSLNINTASPPVTTARSNGSQTEPNMFSIGDNATLEATHADFFRVETEMDMSNITTTYLVTSTPNTRIRKDHSLDHVIGDVQFGVQTRRMTKTTNEQGFISAVDEGKIHKDLYTCLFACFLSQEEPKGIVKALSDSAWVEAMQEELLQYKKDERGIVIRNKARLVAQGHTQEEGIDYDEVFAPVARIEAIRLFLAYTSFMGFMVYQIDVKSAFLYGTIEDEVYVCQPLGFEDPDYPDKVYKVVKALYGLHQAPRAWGYLLVHVYVDDIIFGSTKKELCTSFEKLMKDKFQMSSMGELTLFLGFQVKQKEDGIFISQDKYVVEILRKFGFTYVKSASTPVDTKKPLLKDSDGDDVDVHLYRSMIGSLMYLTSSRPNIMFAVCACARFQVTPKMSHLHAMERIFRYLKGQPKLGLWYPRDSPFDLVAYSDSDYA